jgi:hypothetical protein
MTEVARDDGGLSEARRRLLRGDRWRLAVALVSLALPPVMLRHVAASARTAVPPYLRTADPLDDPTTDATAMARAWQRWGHGDFRIVDDRVFAPVPNAIAVGEYYPLPSLAVFPVFAASGSVPLAVNAAYFLALALFPICLYALYAELARPGPEAALLALLIAWGPSRMNNLGALNTVFTGFAVLAAVAGIRWMRDGNFRDLIVAGGAVCAQSLSSLYGTAMGGIFGVLAVPIALRGRVSPRRLLALVSVVAGALVPGALLQAPFFRLRDEIGPLASHDMFEQHAADLLSLLHGGVFGGPVRDVTERWAPGFPPGAAAFFPTLTILLILGVWAVRFRGAQTRPSPLPWVSLGLIFFLFSLGPVVRAAGRPLGPGIYGLVAGLPVFSTMRGIHRYDQWFHIALGAAAAMALSRLVAASRRPRWLLAGVSGLVILDAWPASVPPNRFPEVSPYAARLTELPPSAIVAAYPFDRAGAAQSWVDQLAHGRRVANGWYAFAPPLHVWLEANLPRLPASGALTALRELGVHVVAVDRSRVPPADLAGWDGLVPGGTPGLLRVEESGRFRLLWLDPRPPSVVDLRELPELLFDGRQALLPLRDRLLAFRLGPPDIEVVIRGPEGAYVDRIRTPVVQPPPVRVFLNREPPHGARIEEKRTGRLVGKAR